MERRLGHFFLNNEIFFQHQILTFYTIIFSLLIININKFFQSGVVVRASFA